MHPEEGGRGGHTHQDTFSGSGVPQSLPDLVLQAGPFKLHLLHLSVGHRLLPFLNLMDVPIQKVVPVDQRVEFTVCFPKLVQLFMVCRKFVVNIMLLNLHLG